MLCQFHYIPGELSVSSKNLPIVHIGLAITTDNSSGNMAKQWNHFEKVFMKISNLAAQETGLHLLRQATVSVGVSFVTHPSANSIKVDQ
jgi:urocanate hydratase